MSNAFSYGQREWRYGPADAGGGGAVHVDDFNRADGPAGAAWAADPLWTVVNNTLYRDGSTDDYCRFLSDLGANHWVEADISTIPANTLVCLLARRSSVDTPNAPTCYRAYVSPDGANGVIDKVVAGAVTNVVTTAAAVGTAACKLRFEVQGSQQRLYRNGTLLATGNDAALTTGNFVGLSTGGAGSPRGYPPWFDNFRCGALPWTP